MTRIHTALLLTIAIVTPLAHAQMAGEEVLYMWTNEEGIASFSQTRPRDQPAIEIAKPMLPPPATQDPTPEIAEVLAIQDDNERTRVLNCRIGLRTRDRLQAHKNIYLKFEDGFFHKISEERRAEEVAKAQQIIGEWCQESDL